MNAFPFTVGMLFTASLQEVVRNAGVMTIADEASTA